MRRVHPAPLLCLLLAAPPARAAEPTGWAAVRAPARGESEAIGSYTAGCLRGGVALPREGPGHRIIRPSRRRFFGHERLAAFLTAFGQAVHGAGLPRVYVGDAAQPRGGPMPSGHSSHQIGLDVDILFDAPARRPVTGELAFEDFPSLVDAEAEKIDPKVWKPAHEKLLRMAAAMPGVARIFVNYAIKAHLCETVRGDRDWLRKIRPWWGHDRHFHVRLDCPPDDAACRPQPPPRGEGCEDVTWFTRAAVEARRKAGRAARRPARKRTLPEECAAVLAAAPAVPEGALAGAPSLDGEQKTADEAAPTEEDGTATR